MSKITTKIKGTTYYNIDYSKLKVGEKLYLVRDKQNIHDKNAIRVLYNEIMLGHIDKQVSTVLANIIDSGVKVKAVLSTILGGPPYENYGLLINISIYENRSENYYRSGTNVPFVENLESFRISESPVNIDIIYQNFSYDKKLYYKHKYKLDDEIIINVKPNFKEMYKSSHNIFENIFNLGIDNYIKDENMKWDKYIEHAKIGRAHV